MLIKIIHFLALAVALGGGVSSMIIGIRSTSAPTEAIPTLRGAQRAIGQSSLISILLLWASGLWLWSVNYGGSSALGGTFHLKLAAVTILTLLSIYSWQRGRAAAKGATPLAPRVARLIGITGLSMGTIAVIFAVLTFSA